MTRDSLPNEGLRSEGRIRTRIWNAIDYVLIGDNNLVARRRREGAGERGRALGVVPVGLFPCPLCLSLRLMDSCRNTGVENHEDHRWSIGGRGFGNPQEEDTTSKLVMEDKDDELD